jgi:glycosyltransferase involved in cell wall biosynthesis
MNNNTVSVILPCYNGEKFLAETIETILAQTYQDFEIVAIDDGSTDGTRDIIAHYTKVRYIYQQNQGVAAARNQGLRQVKGNFLVFLDQDDRLLPNAFEIGVNCLREHPECGFVFGRAQWIKEDGTPYSTIDEPREIANYETLLCGIGIVPPSTIMFPRAVFESIGDFKPALAPADDYDIFLRVARIYPIYCHNQVVVEYRQHNANQSKKSAKLLIEVSYRTLDAQKEFIEQHKEYETAYKNGRNHWRNLFGPYLAYEIVNHIKARKFTLAFQVMVFTLRNYPQALLKYAVEKIENAKSFLLSILK